MDNKVTLHIVIAVTPFTMLPTIKAGYFWCLSLCLYSPGIGVSSFRPCWDIGEVSGKDCFVLVPCTAFTKSFRPGSCAAVVITILLYLLSSGISPIVNYMLLGAI